MLKLSGVHILLSYQCTLECDHCFVWSSPWQSGTLTLAKLRDILQQSKNMGSVTSIYFEGGEPFLFYPLLVNGVQEAHKMGFEAGIVSNSFWAISFEDALEWLKPFEGKLIDLSLSDDFYHWSERLAPYVKHARAAAQKLNIPGGNIVIAGPEAANTDTGVGQLPEGESGVMYRGRAVEKLSGQATHHPAEQFTTCPFENLRNPGRIHVDPLGYVHMCQGIAIGNVFETPLQEICKNYDPDLHPITAPLLKGGPVELAKQHGIPHEEKYADACHMCYTIREKLREKGQFADSLAPDQMYRVVE